MTTLFEPRASPSLVGHERAGTVLHRAWQSGRLHHAWLITGAPGLGKATLAFRFARALLAGPDRVDGRMQMSVDDPVFRQVAHDLHPDLRVIEPNRDPKSARVKTEIGVDVVREASASLHTTVALGGERVLIVDGADLLTRNAANALLKPLEEPPLRTTFLLVADQRSRVLPTLRSRCIEIRLTPLSETDVGAVLDVVAPELEPTTRTTAILLCRGSPGRAIRLASGGGVEGYQALVEEIGKGSGGGLALLDLGEKLLRPTDQARLAFALDLLHDLISRLISSALGRLGPEVFPGEAKILSAVAGRASVDELAAMWESLAEGAVRTEALNLDRLQVLLTPMMLLASHDAAPHPSGGAWTRQ